MRLVMGASLSFSWRRESWNIRQSCGVQQGGSHSAILFSYILGLAISRLDKLWRSRGEPCTHQTFTIAFVDDLLLAFTSWAQADRLTLELQDCLYELGLKLNLTKTQVMTHASQLQLGRGHAFLANSVLPKVQWSESCTYLRKTLRHFEVGESANPSGPLDTTGLLISAMGQSCHAAYEALHKTLRKGHWCSPRDTLRLCNQYVGATWYWYSPVLEPLQRHVDAVRCLQVTMLILLLGLYIPSDLPKGPALFLNRVRRRLVLVLLNLFPQYDWVNVWLRRRWNYVGHVLRFPPDHITRAALCSLCTVKQACPGPWQHALTWGLRQYCQQVDTTADMQSMEAAASCKTSWPSWAQKVVDANLLHHPIVHSSMPEKWQDALRLELGWRVGAHLCITQSGTFVVTWIHEQLGVQTFSDHGDFPAFCSSWIGFVQMDSLALLYDVYVSHDVYDILIHDVQRHTPNAS